jgi:hypothetical protein
MSRNTGKLDRREVLATLGKATAAAVLVTAVGREVHAQSSTLSFVIETHRAYYYAAPQYNNECRIFLYNAGLSQSCTLIFMKDGQTLPANTVAVGGNSASVHYPHFRLAEIREFLRNERPLRVTVNGTNGIATLSNEDYELVGDADI